MRKILFVIQLSIVISATFFLTSCAKIISNEEFDQMHGEPARWYMSEFSNGKKIGFQRLDRKVEGDRITSTTAEITTRKFIGTQNQTTSFKRIVETPDGTVLEFENEKIKGTLNDTGGYDITDIKTGKLLRQVNLPEGTILAEGSDKRMLKKFEGLAEGSTFEIALFSAEKLETSNIKMTKGPKKEIELINKKVILTEVYVEYTSSFGTMPFTAYIDDDFETRKIKLRIGALQYDSIECDRQFALAENDTIIDQKGVIKGPRRLFVGGNHYKVAYLLKPKIEDFKIAVTDNQNVSAGKDGNIILVVQPAEAKSGVSFPYAGNDPKILEELKPTDLLESDDDLIIKLAEKAVGKTKDAKKAAKKIEEFVLGHLSKKHPKEISGFPTALQTAKLRRGDCKGHAVLTAAMCRAAGIPARVVAGYMYAGYYKGQWNAFGGHAWTEAYIGDKWIGLDATRNTWWGLFKSYDASYIATSIFREKSDGVNGISTLGSFEIKDFKRYRK